LRAKTIWIVDAHGYGKRFVVRAEEKADGVRGIAKGDTRVRGEFGFAYRRILQRGFGLMLA